MDEETKQFLEVNGQRYSPHAVQAFEYAEKHGAKLVVERTGDDIYNARLETNFYPQNLQQAKEILAIWGKTEKEWIKNFSESGRVPIISWDDGKLYHNPVHEALASHEISDEVEKYIRDHSLRGRVSKRLNNLVGKGGNHSENPETGKTKVKTGKPNQILEQMAEDLKPGYARKSEESRLEKAWDYLFEPECDANDGVFDTFQKEARESVGNFIKGAAAPYVISTAKRLADGTAGVRDTSKAKIAGALASAVLAAYMTVGSPIYQGHVAKEEAKVLFSEADQLKKDRAALESRIKTAEDRIKYEKDLTKIEQKITVTESKAIEHAQGHPFDKGNLIFPSLLALTNALSAFYEGRRKRAIDKGMDRA